MDIVYGASRAPNLRARDIQSVTHQETGEDRIGEGAGPW